MAAVFEGDGEIQKDVDSYNVWKELGFSEEKNNLIFKGRDENFWGPTGEEGPCGPTTEIYINGIEIWNLVFNEYFQDKNKKLTLLKKKGVDTGMGLERLSMIVQNKPTIFETDLFLLIIKEIENQFNLKYENNNYYFRIIADHIKSAVFLISENIYPSNIERGYILRRLIRRAIRYGKLMNLPSGFLLPLAKKVIEIYKDVYCEIKLSENNILTVILNEEEKFEKTLNKGLKQFEKIAEKKEITGEEAFHLYDTYGFPIELTKELADEKNIKVDIGGFYNFFKKHQEVSRKGVEAKFGGIGKNADYNATRLHTATHLLQSALREVLGESVRQMGSDINSFRLRFDFSFPRKLTNEEIQKIEGIVNQKIKEDLEVKREEMSYEKAIRSGALSFFKEKYPPKVSVYSIGDFSKEICAGPHVKKTSELKKFKIIKEESSGANIRRIRAVLE